MIVDAFVEVLTEFMTTVRDWAAGDIDRDTVVGTLTKQLADLHNSIRTAKRAIEEGNGH